jgi:hypothetical protein
MTSIALGGEVTGRDKWCSRAEEERSLVDSTIWFGDGSMKTARRQRNPAGPFHLVSARNGSQRGTRVK